MQANHCQAANSTGIKAGGKSEWNARKHGRSKRRLWCKIDIGIDEETLEIRTIEVMSSGFGDAPMLPDLLNQIPPDQNLATITFGGTCDKRKYHDAIAAQKAHAIIPPLKNDKLWKPDTAGAREHNEGVRSLKYLSHAMERNLTGYHRLSHVETKVNCIKMLDQPLTTRGFNRQVVKLQIRAAILNGFKALSIPRTVPIS